MQKEFDLIIVGAGLVGASLACAIAQQHQAKMLRIGLIDANTDSRIFSGENFDARVVALTPASQQLLAKIGVWDDIANTRMCAYTNMHVWDGEGTAHIHFNSAEVRQPWLGHITENAVITHALAKKLATHPQITIIQPARVITLLTSDKVHITLDDGNILSTDLLIAADGAHSAVRELAGFEIREWDYGHTAIVTTVQTEFPHQHTAWQRFMSSGPLAFLPLPVVNGKHFCSIVWSAEHQLADELMQLDDVNFARHVGVAFEHKLGHIVHVAQRFAIPLRQRHAKTYVQPRIVLVGDAAHNIHPLAGQGVNLGLLDVIALAQEIERALQRKIPLHDISILRRYQRQRLAENLVMMSAMEGFKRLFGHKSLLLNWLRNTGMRQLNSLAELKKILVKAAMGPGQ